VVVVRADMAEAEVDILEDIIPPLSPIRDEMLIREKSLNNSEDQQTEMEDAFIAVGVGISDGNMSPISGRPSIHEVESVLHLGEVAVVVHDHETHPIYEDQIVHTAEVRHLYSLSKPRA